MAPSLAADRIGASRAEFIAHEDDETAAGGAAARTPQPLRIPDRFRWL
jgi:hypothetical protein